jgi:hypothetical protein
MELRIALQTRVKLKAPSMHLQVASVAFPREIKAISLSIIAAASHSTVTPSQTR